MPSAFLPENAVRSLSSLGMFWAISPKPRPTSPKKCNKISTHSTMTTGRNPQIRRHLHWIFFAVQFNDEITRKSQILDRVVINVCTERFGQTPVKSLAVTLLLVPFESEKDKGRGENSGEGKTYHKAPPQKRFLNPPLMIRSPPPCSHAVIFPFSLEQTGHRPDESHFLRPPKPGPHCSTFPPPNRTMRFAPPPL